jgi:hypothetical protein
MKASEYIKLFEALLAAEGDVEVMRYDAGNFSVTACRAPQIRYFKLKEGRERNTYLWESYYNITLKSPVKIIVL